MKYFCIIGLVLFTGVWAQGQQATANYHATLIAQEQVSRLKQGALFVMLDNPVQSLVSLRRKGHYEKAERLETELKNKNLETILAFKKEYFFSLVYFFTSDYLPKIKENRWEEVVFLDLKGEPDKGITVDSDFVLLAHIGKSTREQKTEDMESTPSGIGVTALVIRDTQFRSLEAPFPYRIRTYEGSGIKIFKRPYDRTVRMLNAKLFTFFGH